MSGFDGTAGIVTGGGTGIGRASALAFAARGAAIGVIDVDLGAALETVRLIEEAEGRAIAVGADVSREDEVRAAVSQVASTYERLDFAHNNAGIMGANGLLAEIEPADWERVLTVNLTSVFLCMKFELPYLLAQGRGAIVNTASGAGVHPVPNMPAYVASKHGVIGLSKAAALDYASFGIRVNAICPGTTRTPMYEKFAGRTAGFEQIRTARIPLGRLGTAEEIAAGAVWLCSDDASFVTGAALSLDGGRLIS
jgi:NAD(P)-dependent dehydrogenase (short-subunit alcohol dehydrogenase family)